MAKIRTRSSYWGKTKEAIKRQRSGLILGSQKREGQEIRYSCFWEISTLDDKQFIFYGRMDRNIKYIPKKELKSEAWLDNWWNRQELEEKKHLYWSIMEPFSQEEKAPILNDIQECMEKKLASLKSDIRG